MTVLEKSQDMLCSVRVPVKVVRSNVSFTAACFGGDDFNWSLAPLQERGDGDKHPEFAGRLSAALRSLGVLHAYAPNPTQFNGQIIWPGDLETGIYLRQDGLMVWRQKDKPADGVFLNRQRDGGILSAGGCSVIVATWREYLLFAHAGRDCLLDRERIKSRGERQSRGNESVVNAIISAFIDLGMTSTRELDHAHAWIFWAIKPENFRHDFETERKEHREYNNGLAEYLPQFMRWDDQVASIDNRGVSLDTARLARAQFLKNGVPSENVHLEYAYLPDHLPHTRKGDGKGRYLVAIARQS